jgi:TonB family protein
MTRPILVQGASPRCSPEATAHQLDVRVLVECVITVDGTTRGCRIRSGHPLLNEISLQAAFASRFEPATVNDQPVDVAFGIPYRFVCVQAK